MKHAQHHETNSVEAILKHISRTENLQHDLSILGAARERSSQHGVLGQHLGLFNDFTRHYRSERGVLPVEKYRKTVEIGESRVRPFELRRLRQLRNAGVPQV